MEHYYQQIEVEADFLGLQYTLDDVPIPDGLSKLLWSFGCHQGNFCLTWEYERVPPYCDPEVGYNDEILMTDAKFRAWRLNAELAVPNELREELAVWASKLLPQEPVTVGWEED